MALQFNYISQYHINNTILNFKIRTIDNSNVLRWLNSFQLQIRNFRVRFYIEGTTFEIGIRNIT